LLINETFEHDAGGTARKALVGEGYAKRPAARHA
jgi:hypothetical protein